MRISDWSSDVCSSDLLQIFADVVAELIDDGAGIQIVGRVRAELYLAVAARGLLVEDVLPAVPRRPEHVHDQAAEVGDLRQVEARHLRQRPESDRCRSRLVDALAIDRLCARRRAVLSA